MKRIQPQARALDLSQRYTRREVGRILGLEPGRLRYWERLCLVNPSARWGEKFYTFGDLVALRSLKKRVIDNHVPARRVRLAIKLIESQFGAESRPRAGIAPGRSRPRNSRRPAGLRASIQSVFCSSGPSRSICPSNPPSSTPWWAPRRKIFSDRARLRKSQRHFAASHRKLFARRRTSLRFGSKPTSISASPTTSSVNLTDARDAFRAAVQLDPLNGISRYNLGCTLEELTNSKKPSIISNAPRAPCPRTPTSISISLSPTKSAAIAAAPANSGPSISASPRQAPGPNKPAPASANIPAAKKNSPSPSAAPLNSPSISRTGSQPVCTAL